MVAIKISDIDNVAIALKDLEKGQTIQVGGISLVLKEDVQRGHKFALQDISDKSPIVKYGAQIGLATTDIAQGCWVHTHNVRTSLSEKEDYHYNKIPVAQRTATGATFSGYLRADGRAATRNELWIIPMVGCVNGVANRLVEKNQSLVSGSIDGLLAFPHPYGCSQLGGDLKNTRKLLSSLVRHPNAGGVLVLSLGCENNTLAGFKEELGPYDSNRVKFLTCQESTDELAEGGKLLEELAVFARQAKRQELSTSKLVIGLKCGGSDGLSGITANPVVGNFSDRLVAEGGTSILTEVPEMFGAENLLLGRCKNEDIYSQAVDMIRSFKDYFVAHDQMVYENPSPGNKDGGITTLEDKSCGCVQKGGTGEITSVLSYAEHATTPGVNLMWGPGNDLVSSTALAASGALIVLFTTGRGTPFGCPVPTLKISSNTPLYEKKPNWIDFNAGGVATGEEDIETSGERLFEKVRECASGQKALNEINGYKEIAIFKDGVVL